MRKLSFSYYLFMLLLAPLVPRLLQLLNNFNLGWALPGVGDTLLILLLATGLVLLLLKAEGTYWELTLAALWAICQARIFHLGLIPLTTVWKAFDAGQGISYMSSLPAGSALIAILLYIIILVGSIKLAPLKGKACFQFVLWSLVFYQLGHHLISYKI